MTRGRALSLERRFDGARVTIDRRVPAGPVTVLGFARGEAGSLKLLVAEAWALPCDRHEPASPCTLLRFALPAELLYERWVAEGPTYEVVVGAGHVAEGVCATARTLRISCRWVR